MEGGTIQHTRRADGTTRSAEDIGTHAERGNQELRYPADDIAAIERIVPANLSNVGDGQLLAFALLSLKPGFTYECRWVHR